ncbi:3-hydroxyacyl-CoA dehydrogenase family protein [Chloroflexota bacterium]
MEIKTVGVLGVGVMGHGIVQVAAQNGYDVIAVDVSDEIVQKGLKEIDGNLDRMVTKEKITQADKDATMGRIKPTADISALAKTDYVVEAIFEDMELKRKNFQELDQLTRPEVVLSSNTSTLSITEIAAVTKRPDKVVGMHFFNPAPVMRLVEVIRGYMTSDDTVAISKELAEKGFKKETVVVKKDTPGYIVNRAIVPYIIEAMRMYEEGVASPEDIDKAIKLGVNFPMGPFELMDLMGNDTNLDVFSSLERELGKEFTFQVSYTLKALVKTRKLGRKTGEGWYKYEK